MNAVVNGIKVYWNKFPGKCACCRKPVKAGQGVLWKESVGWLVAHVECKPELADHLLAEQIKKDCEAAEKATREANRIAALKARLAELEAQCGIDWKAGLTLESHQYSYSDVDVVEYKLQGTITPDEFKEMLRLKYPTQSSSGALRWLSGVTLTSFNPDKVAVRFTTSICD